VPELSVAGFKLLNTPPGNVELQSLDAAKWKNGEQLWWTGAHPKDKLVLAVPVAKGGKYQLSVNLTKADDYGIVELSLDGKKVAEPLDLYNPTVVPSGPIALGVDDLKAGQHKLSVKILGANPKAKKAYMFGIDRIDLKPVR
jgi:hypothetical protein